MGKFRIRLKFQAFELEVDGEREDIPAVTSAIQQQFAGLLQPSMEIADGHKELSQSATPIIDAAFKQKSRNNSKRRSSRPNENSENQIVDFRHDSGKFGNPQQSWSVSQKCIWLLFVLSDPGPDAELSASQLTATFNTQFKAAGKLHPPNVTRDLGKAKIDNPAPLGEDKGKWFLTDEGKRQAIELVQQSLAPKG